MSISKNLGRLLPLKTGTSLREEEVFPRKMNAREVETQAN